MAEINQIFCPHCGQTYTVQPEQWAVYNGRTINCTRCGKPFIVTAPPELGVPPTMPGPPAPSGAMPPGYAPYPGMYGPQKVASGWAVAGLVGGILGFCFAPLSLLGVIGGIIGIGSTRDLRVSGRGMAVTGLVLGLIGLLVVLPIEIAAVIPGLHRAQEEARRVACASHLQALGLSLIQYANMNQGQFPDRLADLATLSPPPAPRDFVCPDTGAAPPNTSSPQRLAADLVSGVHCSYVYVGKGLRMTAGSDTVLMYEPLSNHRREGMNALFADGSTRWLDADEADQVLQQHYSTTQPIRIPPAKDGD